MAVIGRELRTMYAGIVAEGVSERFAEILRKLDEATNEGEPR
jgi:Anti-sigma factor NepR